MISSLFYFLYFGGIGIYVPYWTLYLRERGLTSLQIAVIYAIPSLVRILFSGLYGYLADRFQKRRTVLVYASFLQVVPLALLPFTSSFSALFALIACYSICNAPILPFAEATVQEEHEKGNLDYGRTRFWGTLSFILVALSFGKILDRAPSTTIVYAFLLSQLLLAFFAAGMPQGKPGNPLEYKKAGGILREGHTQLFFACVFLMAVGHGIFYGFFSIYLKQLGIVESAIGVQWAIAAGGELLIFLFASRILSAFSYRFLFSGCLLLAVVRWLLTYASDSYFVLCAAQSLHAFTFGVFHITSIRLVHAIFPQGYRSLGQSLLSASGAGLGLFTGVLVGGLLWDVQQGKAFLTSSIIVFAAFLLSLRFKPQG